MPEETTIARRLTRTAALLLVALVCSTSVGVGAAWLSGDSAVAHQQGAQSEADSTGAPCAARADAPPCVMARELTSFSPATPATPVEFGVAATGGRSGVGEVGGSSCGRSCHGILAITSDSGRSWQLRSTGTTVPGEVLFPTPSQGYVAASPIDPAEQGGAACGEDALSRPCSTILFTDDAGVRWTRVARSLPPVFDIEFSSPSSGLAALDSCASSWPPAKPPPPGDFEDSLPPAPCGGSIAQTRDGGRSWRTVERTSAPVVAIAMFGQLVLALEVRMGGLRVSQPGWLAVVRSDNGGRSWQPPVRLAVSIPQELTGQLSVQLLLASGSVGAVPIYSTQPCNVCSFASLFTTADGGERWNLAHSPAPDVPPVLKGSKVSACGALLPVALAYTSAIKLVTLDEQGGSNACSEPGVQLDGTTDGGTRWQVLRALGAGADPASLVLEAGGTGFAAGPGLLVTSDDARHLTQVLPAPVPGGNLDFVSGNIGYGTGTPSDPGAVLATADAGRSWHTVGELGADPVALDFADAWRGWALVLTSQGFGGSTYAMLVTSDGGRHWRTTAPLPGRFFSAATNSPVLAASSGRDATLLLPPPYWTGPIQGCKRALAAAPGRAALLTTDDGGRSWQVRTSLVPGAATGTSAAALLGDGATVLVVGGEIACGPPPHLVVSADDGRDWRTLASWPQLSPLRIIDGEDADFFLSSGGSTSIWLWMGIQPSGDWAAPSSAPPSAQLLHSVDDGRSWTSLTPLRSVFVADVPVIAPKGLMENASVQFLGRDGWLYCSGATDDALWHTTDAGRHWYEVAEAGKPSLP